MSYHAAATSATGTVPLVRRRRRPSVIFLGAVFSWSFYKALEFLARGSLTADYILFEGSGLGALLMMATGVTALLDLATLWFLFKPAPAGLVTALTSIGLAALQTCVGFALAIANPALARRALIVSRESRGLPVNPDTVDAVGNPLLASGMLALSLALSGLLLFLVLRTRGYFQTRGAAPATVT